MSGTPPRSPSGGPPELAGSATQVFVEHRELLFAIVYNLLGSVADTEDVLQETWLSWAGRNQDPRAEPIDNPRGYLVRIAVNQTLARQAAIKRQRETYVGPWLPEPLLTSDSEDAVEAAMRAETVSIALLVVLETLSPLERAVFVLHEVFGYSHPEIAGILDRRPAAVRQLSHRAREHVHARRHEELLAAGIHEIAVFHAPVEDMLPYQGALPFATVADPARTLYAEFGVGASLRSVLHPRAWISPLNPRAWSVVVGGIRAGAPPFSTGGQSVLGLPADFLIAPDGRVLAAKYGRHANDQWSVDDLLQLARAPATDHHQQRPHRPGPENVTRAPGV
jgi:RNA polymerase sigma factor (sigma-70 family)